MKNFRTITALVLCVLVLTGCSENCTFYDYKFVENGFDWGKISAKLSGSEKRNGFKVIKGSPYNLLIWFDLETPLEGSITISELKLIDAKTKSVSFEVNDNMKKPIEKSKLDYGAFFPFKNIGADYNDMELHIKFSLNNADSSSEYNTIMYFQKDYKEFRRTRGV